MPRPQTKSQILSESQKEHEALEKFLSSLSPEQMTEPGMLGDWSAKGCAGAPVRMGADGTGLADSQPSRRDPPCPGGRLQMESTPGIE